MLFHDKGWEKFLRCKMQLNTKYIEICNFKRRTKVSSSFRSICHTKTGDKKAPLLAVRMCIRICPLQNHTITFLLISEEGYTQHILEYDSYVKEIYELESSEVRMFWTNKITNYKNYHIFVIPILPLLN